MEIWKGIKGYKGLYKVSNTGKVLSIKRNLILVPCLNRNYLKVNLYDKGKRAPTSIHRIVALNFINNPKKYKQVNHKDGNKLNNNVENLEWCDAAFNSKHAAELGLYISGEKHPFSKFKNEDIRFIRTCGIGNLKLSKLFSVAEHTIFRIKNKQSYKNVV